jgi:hypothetical protein
LYIYIYVEKRREKNAGDEKVLLRNQATIAQVITKPNVCMVAQSLARIREDALRNFLFIEKFPSIVTHEGFLSFFKGNHFIE